MPGLDPQAQQPAQQPAAAQGQPQGAAPQRALPEEEKAAYNRFVGFSLIKIWEEGFRDKIIKSMQKAPDISDAMASAAVMVGSTIYKKAKEQGANIPDAVVLHGGWEIMNNLAELGTSAGIEITQEDIEDAMHVAAEAFIKMGAREGWVDVAQLEQGAAELQEMEAKGEIDPALRERANARRMGPGGQQQ